MGRALRPRKTTGLTLAETLLSLTLLTLVMLAVLNLFPSALANAKLTRTGWLARVAAQNEIEALAGQPFGALRVGTRQAQSVTLPDGAVADLVTTVEAAPGHPQRLLKRIRCQVTWKGRATQKSAIEEVYVHALRR